MFLRSSIVNRNMSLGSRATFFLPLSGVESSERYHHIVVSRWNRVFTGKQKLAIFCYKLLIVLKYALQGGWSRTRIKRAYRWRKGLTHVYAMANSQCCRAGKWLRVKKNIQTITGNKLGRKENLLWRASI